MHFFPSPGCTLERAVFTRTPDGPPIGTVERIELSTSWGNLITFRKRLSHLRATGLHVDLRRPVPPGRDHGGNGMPRNTVAELIADGATLDVDGTRFALPELRLTEVGPDKAIGYSTLIDSPHPPGRIRSSGSVGPFRTGNISGTPAHGKFEVLNADLGRYPSLDGTLHATGDFHGTLSELATKGRAEATDFEVNANGHPTDLSATWDAAVNLLTGALRLNAVEADFLHTHLSAHGSVEQRTVSLDFTSRQARLEDLARLTTKSGNSALYGPMRLDAHVELPPEGGQFIERLRINGSFRVDNGWWRKQTTQTKIDDLSARARREKEQAEDGHTADRVATDLAGTVRASGGLARFTGLQFRVPGANATGAGTYNLLSKRIDVKGSVTMAADVSEATSGFKSVVLKPFNALFRKNHRKHGATLPVSITGTYPHPQYRVRLH